MTVPVEHGGPSIEVTAQARAALLAHVSRDPERHRYVRVHVGIG